MHVIKKIRTVISSRLLKSLVINVNTRIKISLHAAISDFTMAVHGSSADI